MNECRANGILQSELAKELGIIHNNFFRVVRTLECLGLIVKQPVVVKKETNVITNMLYLYRYTKHLGVKQSPDEISEQETDLLGSSSGRQILLLQEISPRLLKTMWLL